jgi:hypothetical protein
MTFRMIMAYYNKYIYCSSDLATQSKILGDQGMQEEISYIYICICTYNCIYIYEYIYIYIYMYTYI